MHLDTEKPKSINLHKHVLTMSEELNVTPLPLTLETPYIYVTTTTLKSVCVLITPCERPVTIETMPPERAH